MIAKVTVIPPRTNPHFETSAAFSVSRKVLARAELMKKIKAP